eukprot:m.186814 g.186814  ORF g.186814 m.186814 type:complete len:92 (-) comp14762_c0_seq1:866-1141(-)
MAPCKLRRCQGKRGCLCPKKPAVARVYAGVSDDNVIDGSSLVSARASRMSGKGTGKKPPAETKSTSKQKVVVVSKAASIKSMSQPARSITR